MEREQGAAGEAEILAATEDEYGERVKRLLRSQMVAKGVGYDELAEKLTAAGMPETAVNLRNKVSRGKFTAAILLAAFDALGLTVLHTNTNIDT